MTAITFHARENPLPAVAVAALGPHVRTLAQKVLTLPDAALARWSGVVAPGALVLLGEDLPWFDGALYLSATGALLWPAWAEPDVHPMLLERALRSAFPDAPRGPLALLLPRLDSRPLIVPLAGALPVSRRALVGL